MKGIRLGIGRNGADLDRFRASYGVRVTTSSEIDLSVALAGVAAAALGVPAVEIAGLERMSGGASRETWSFDAVTPDTVVPLILRRAPRSDADGALMLLEAAAMREAARVGVPEPEVFAAAAKPGAPFAISGILDGQQDELLARYAEWFDTLRVDMHDGWVRISGTRRGR